MNRRPRYWFRLLRFAAALALNMERQWFIWLFVIADAYLVMTLLSAQRPFWFDELFTLYMTRLPDMATVWAALKGGADLNPPLFYAATKLFHNLSGGKEWAIRVPAIIGFLVMMFGLYRYILRYGSRLAGMVAMTFPLVTGAFYYSSEGRAYGMEFGFIAVAAVCWQAATRGEWRLYNLAGLTLCLAGALLSHCYAVLAVAPFGLAEAVRTLQRKRIDWPVWAALAVPCLSVLSYLPMMAAVTGGDPFDNPVYFTTARAAYELILGAAWWPLVFALSVLVLFGRGWRRKDGFAGIPAHEIALAGGFVAAPVLGVVLASAVTKIFMDRYGLAATLGFSQILGFMVVTQTARRRVPAALIVLIFLGGFLWRPAFVLGKSLTGTQVVSGRTEPRKELDLAELDRDLPIVVANGLLFLELDHDQSSEVTSRLHFLIDRDTAIQFTGTLGFEQFRTIAKWFPLRSHLDDYGTFLRTERAFYVISNYDFPMDWVMQKLREDKVTLEFQGQVRSLHGSVIVAKVSRVNTPKSQPPREAK